MMKRVLPVSVPAAVSSSASSSLFTPPVYNGFVDAIGNTPMILLKGPSERTKCKIYGKAEFLNPGGSVKDRAAKFLIDGLERDEKLIPGSNKGTIVEGTAGNTGIGLSYIASAKGYKSVIVIPRTQTQEKKDALRQAGATVVEVDAKPYKDPNNYIKLSGRLAAEIQDGVWVNQFDNVDNRRAHIKTTGPEILRQLPNLDGFSCAIGTGGTLVGCATYFRNQSRNIKIGHTDPKGAALHRYFKDGVLKSIGDSITEGIGQGRVTANIGDDFYPDYTYEIDDDIALRTCYELITNDGLSLGLSSGINVAGAERLARELGPGHTIATILCDSAFRYAGKMFNIDFLRQQQLPKPTWLDHNASASDKDSTYDPDDLLPMDIVDALNRSIEKN